MGRIHYQWRKSRKSSNIGAVEQETFFNAFVLVEKRCFTGVSGQVGIDEHAQSVQTKSVRNMETHATGGSSLSGY